MRWTEDQQRAISHRGENILVTAAAGSGKTAVLVERIVSMLREGADLDRMLIVTFTRAAASAMRAKLSEKLYELSEDDDALYEQTQKVEHAAICTIDSFCVDFLRAHFQRMDSDPGFHVVEESERSRLAQKAVEAAMESASAEQSEEFRAFVKWRDPKAVQDTVLSVMTFLDAQSEPAAWVQMASAGMSFEDAQSLILQSVRSTIDDIRCDAEDALGLCAEGAPELTDTIRADIESLRGAALLSYGGLRALIASKSVFQKLKPPKASEKTESREKIADMRKAYQGRFKRSVEPLLALDETQARADASENQKQIRALLQIASDARAHLDKLLDDENALGFPDLERRVYEALKDDETMRAARTQYRDAVFVDEYQDVSALQEALLARLSPEGKRFLVGDVKQSIYRFRNADPGVFLEKHKQYGRGEGGTRIALSQNFRSRRPILDYANLVFERAMNRSGSEFPYDEEARLKPGAAYEKADPPCEVLLLCSKEQEKDADESEADSLTEAEREAEAVADRVLALHGSPLENGPAAWKDFAVICRVSSNVLPRVADVLIRRGIPAHCETQQSYYDAMEIRIALALLRLTENRRRDADWIAALRSPLADLSADDLARIRLCARNEPFSQAILVCAKEDTPLAIRLRAAMEKLDAWRALSRSIPLSELVFTVLRESGWFAFVGSLWQGAARQRNLLSLCDRASQFAAKYDAGLAGFLAEAESAGDAPNPEQAKGMSEGEDAVRLTTIHKSKGLEYPIVIGMRLGRSLNKGGREPELTMHPRLGAAMKYIDPDLGTRRDILARVAIREQQKRESLEEELRLLYVLMTRARERLVLVGTVDAEEKARARYARFRQPDTLLDALLPPALRPGAQCVTVTWNPAITDAVYQTTRQTRRASDGGLARALAWRYPHAEARLLPFKMTVTGIARALTGPVAPVPGPERPAFLEVKLPTGAQRGTTTHQALAALDFDALRGLGGQSLEREISAQLQTLAASKRVGDPARLPVGQIARFMESDLGRRALASDEVHREWPFNLTITARDAGVADSDETVLVQGTIDLCFVEAGQWTLVDYKTDREEDENALADRYRPQLALYARALAEITGRPVRDIYLASIRMGENIRL